MKVNCVVKRGVNDGELLALAEHFRGTGHTLRFIEYMDVGHSNGWRLDDVVPAAEIVGDARCGLRDRAGRRRLSRRGRPPLPLPGRVGRVRRHHLRHAAVLRHVHARPPLRRGQALHLSLRRPRPRSARAGPRRRVGRRAHRRGANRVGKPFRPLFGAQVGRHDRPAEGRDELHRRVAAQAVRAQKPVGGRRPPPSRLE